MYCTWTIALFRFAYQIKVLSVKAQDIKPNMRLVSMSDGGGSDERRTLRALPDIEDVCPLYITGRV
jgi:hypothetical protein